MMEREQLRKADIFSGAAIVCVGVFIISQAVQILCYRDGKPFSVSVP